MDLVQTKLLYQKGNSGDGAVHFFFYVLKYILDNTSAHVSTLARLECQEFSILFACRVCS